MFTQRNLFIILGVVLLSIAVYPSKVESSFKKGWPRAGEFLIDTNVVYIGVPYNQKCSSIAFDGNNYLVVWQDNRRYSETGHSDFFDIYAARVTPSGEVLDPAGGILVSTGAYSRDNPSVAFNGTDYLVVWGDRRYHWWSCIYGARVDTSGTVLDTAGIYIAGQESGPYCYLWFPSVASDGTNWFAVWLDGRTNKFSIYGARVSPSGTVLDTMGIPISIDATTDEFAPSVAFDGENYLVVWGDENLYGGITWSDLYCARVTPEGEVLDTAGIPIATGPYNQWYPSVAFDGTNYLVVWDDYGPSDYIIYGARVSPAGTVLDPGGFGISHSGAKIYPSVAFDGNNYLVVWQDGRSGITYDIYGVRVSPSGSIQGSEFPVSTGNGHSMGIDPEPAIAFDGTNYMVTWMDIRNVECTGQNIHSARVTPQSTVLDTTGIIVSSTTHSQWEPAVVFDGINYLVAWRDNRHGNSLFVTGQWSIYGARVNSIGTVLDTESIAILSEQVTTYGPSVAFDGTDYLCVWHDLRNWPGNTYDIYGARVAQSGVVLDTTGIPISTAGYYERYPSIAFDGTNYLCVWQTWSSGSYCKIVGGRIDPSGNILDTTSISGLTATNNPYLPPVAFDGINYLVVWEDNRNGNVDIYGARVDTSGTVLDTSGFAISIAIDNQQNPSVAFDGINYLVVWEDFRDGDADIYGARLDTSGTVLDTSGFAISTAIDEQRNLSVTFDGTDYFVVWEDFRNGEADIYGAKITPSGGLIDSFAISTQPGDQVDPNLCRGSGDQIFIVYSGFVDYINGKQANTMRIWGKYYPFVGIEEAKAKIQPVSSDLRIYPIPFKQRVNIYYQTINKEQTIDIKIYDICGRLIKRFDLSDSHQSLSDGVIWEGKDDFGNQVQSGIYFLRLAVSPVVTTGFGGKAGDYNLTKKLLLLR